MSQLKEECYNNRNKAHIFYNQENIYNLLESGIYELYMYY